MAGPDCEVMEYTVEQLRTPMQRLLDLLAEGDPRPVCSDIAEVYLTGSLMVKFGSRRPRRSLARNVLDRC